MWMSRNWQKNVSWQAFATGVSFAGLLLFVVMIANMSSEFGQGTIRSREGEHLGRTDVGVIQWRAVWQRELRALAEGQPLKEWTLPDRFEF